jgi:S1-C subfamily serine protease
MTNILDVSRALGSVVAAAEASVVAVHGGRCEVSSGIAWGKSLVVTGMASLEGEQGVDVATATGRVPATLVGTDPRSGVALLRVDAELSPFKLADASGLRVGELVVALARTGRGLGARLGIVSRLGGPWRLPGGARFDHYVESDVTPTPGLSGSALVTASGELIGVNAPALGRGTLVSLPATGVSRIVDALLAHGRVRRARLGVGLERVELPRVLADRLGRRRGLVVVAVVEGGPAERAGLLLGDVIIALRDKPTERVDDVYDALDESAIDADVYADILRAGTEQRVLVKPEARS